MARILIIGGTGFIGSRVTVQLLDAGHEIALLHRGNKPLGKNPRRVSEILGDRHDLAASGLAITKFQPEVIVDTVLSSGRQASELAKLVNALGVRLIALSSMDVYRACAIVHGRDHGELEPLPLTEESRLREPGPIYPNEIAAKVREVFPWLDDDYDKVEAERTLFDQCAAVTTVLRLPFVYGPGDPLHRVGQWVSLMRPEKKQITIASTYSAFRGPRGYVEDVASAVVLAVAKPAAAVGIFNVAELEAYSEMEFARLIADAIGWPGELLPRDDQPDVNFPGDFRQHWIASSERIRSRLGYRESLPIHERLRRSIAWERSLTPVS